jgi:hypothetical protein
MLLKWTSAASVLPDCRRKLCIRVSTVTRGPSASGPWKKHVLIFLNFDSDFLGVFTSLCLVKISVFDIIKNTKAKNTTVIIIIELR